MELVGVDACVVMWPCSNLIISVLQRRLVFVPLPEPGPLHSNNRDTLPGDEAPDRPLLDRRQLLQQGLLYHLEFWAGYFLIFLKPKLSLLVESS